MPANVCAIDHRGGTICSITSTGGGTAAATAPADSTLIDGLCGSITCAAIKQFQLHHFKKSDSRVDPGQRTIQKLDEIQRSGAVVIPITPLTKAMDALPLATQWCTAAAAHVSALMAAMSAGPSSPAFAIANIHFHFDRDPGQLLASLTKVQRTYNLILQTFAGAVKYFREGPVAPKSPYADAPMGGYHYPHTDFNFITFRPGFVDCGPNCRAAMLVHEGAHFVGGTNEIAHFAMEFPAPDGQPQDGSSRNYAQLLTREAIRNASSYAAFAIHAATGIDSRFGASDITK
jgi:hypothetical protein